MPSFLFYAAGFSLIWEKGSQASILLAVPLFSVARPHKYYFILISYYSIEELVQSTSCYSLSEFLRSCLQPWLAEGAGELLERWGSTLEEVGLKCSCWPSVLGGGGVRRLWLCWICAAAAGESSSCWSWVPGGTAEGMMPWGAAVEPLLRQFTTKLAMLPFNVQWLLVLVSQQHSLLAS